MMKPIHACLVGLLVSLGCGGDTPQSKPVAATYPRQIAQEAQQQQPADEQVAGGNAIENNLVALREGQAQVKAGPGPAEPLPRKIVRTATIKIIVDDFGRAEQELRNLLGAQNGSYIARAEITGSSGAPRHGEWTIRVPVAQFESFLDTLLKLGIPQRNSVDSKDVTEEFYDVEARVKNKKVEEDRLLKHLEKSTGKLDEILRVESELSRVRGEIEHMEGRLRLLANLSALTTVTLQIQEIKDYVPPQAPAFGSSIASTFSSSYDMLVAFLKALILVVVALTPWLPFILLVAGTLWYFWRRRVRASQQPS